MKTFLLTVLVLLGLSQLSQAQEVGIRFGDAFGGHYAVDARFSGLHADVSFGDGVGLEVLWDLLYQGLGEKGFDWYVGAGLSAYLDDPFLLGISGEVGLEYHFDFPLALGVDWRPTFIVIDYTEFEGGWFGFNARYCFGK
ncbi:MAG: outer membrane insertion C- signal [Ignavibacteriales bacterium]